MLKLEDQVYRVRARSSFGPALWQSCQLLFGLLDLRPVLLPKDIKESREELPLEVYLVVVKGHEDKIARHHVSNRQARVWCTQRKEVWISKATRIVCGMELANHETFGDKIWLGIHLCSINDVTGISKLDVWEDEDASFVLSLPASLGLQLLELRQKIHQHLGDHGSQLTYWKLCRPHDFHPNGIELQSLGNKRAHRTLASHRRMRLSQE